MTHAEKKAGNLRVFISQKEEQVSIKEGLKFSSQRVIKIQVMYRKIIVIVSPDSREAPHHLKSPGS